MCAGSAEICPDTYRYTANSVVPQSAANFLANVDWKPHVGNPSLVERARRAAANSQPLQQLSAFLVI